MSYEDKKCKVCGKETMWYYNETGKEWEPYCLEHTPWSMHKKSHA